MCGSFHTDTFLSTYLHFWHRKAITCSSSICESNHGLDFFLHWFFSFLTIRSPLHNFSLTSPSSLVLVFCFGLFPPWVAFYLLSLPFCLYPTYTRRQQHTWPLHVCVYTPRIHIPTSSPQHPHFMFIISCTCISSGLTLLSRSMGWFFGILIINQNYCLSLCILQIVGTASAHEGGKNWNRIRKIKQSREPRTARNQKTPAPSKKNTRPCIRRCHFASSDSDGLSEAGDRRTEFEVHQMSSSLTGAPARDWGSENVFLWALLVRMMHTTLIIKPV